MSDETYDSYEGDFDVSDYDDTGAEETTTRTETESTASTTDMVARLLRGENVSDDDIADHKERNPRARETMTKDVDAHGRAFRNEGEAKPAATPESSIADDTVYSREWNEKFEQVQAADQHIKGERQRLQNEYEAGRMSYDEFQQAEYQLGQQYGQWSSFAQRLETDRYRLELQRNNAHKYLEDHLGDAWKGDNRAATQEAAVRYLQERGISTDLISDIEEPSIVLAVVQAAQSADQISSLKDEVAALKAANRRLKGDRAEGRSRGQRASQAGVTGDKQADMLSQVTEVLRGAKKGGRR